MSQGLLFCQRVIYVTFHESLTVHTLNATAAVDLKLKIDFCIQTQKIQYVSSLTNWLNFLEYS